MIPFNKIYTNGKELDYIKDTISFSKIGGDGKYGQLCEEFFEKRYSFNKCLMTTSCTAALEMSAILSGFNDNDEVIMPSFTFVSTANAVLLRRAMPVFADSMELSPNIDQDKIEKLITKNTKALIVVHYAGIACNMDKIMTIADNYGLIVIEDAAHAINSFYKNKPLGSFGNMAAFSFHETKNITAGEGGMLVVNDKRFEEQSEIVREKGTNRAQYLRGQLNKYEWVNVGSSYVSSEMNMAFLYAQLEDLDLIQKSRIKVWEQYYNELRILQEKCYIKLPVVPDYATNNAHIFYMVCNSKKERDSLIKYLKDNNISSAFHYLSLHKSPYFRNKYKGPELKNSDRYSDCLLRLPLYCGLKEDEVSFITDKVRKFFSC